MLISSISRVGRHYWVNITYLGLIFLATREPSTKTRNMTKAISQPSLNQSSNSFEKFVLSQLISSYIDKSGKPIPVARRTTRSTNRSDRDDKSRSADYDSPPPSDIYDIFSV